MSYCFTALLLLQLYRKYIKSVLQMVSHISLISHWSFYVRCSVNIVQRCVNVSSMYNIPDREVLSPKPTVAEQCLDTKDKMLPSTLSRNNQILTGVYISMFFHVGFLMKSFVTINTGKRSSIAVNH